MKLSWWCPEADRGAPPSSGVSRTGLAASHSVCCANVRCFLGEIGASPGGRREPHPPLLLQGSLLQPKLSYLTLPLPPTFWATGVPSTHLPIAQTDSLMTIVRVCNEREGAASGEEPPTSHISREQPVTAREAEGAPGPGPADWGWGAGQGASVFPTPSSRLQSRTPAHRLCSNYKWFDNFRPGPAIKNKEEDRQHCLLRTPLIGGVNFNGLSWCLRGGNSRNGALAASHPCDAHPTLLAVCLRQKGTPQGRGCVFIYLFSSLVPGAQ